MLTDLFGWISVCLSAIMRPIREASMTGECVQCGVGDEEASLTRCPVCHKMVCEECQFVKSGRTFCSRGCGELFFHEEEEDIEPGEA